MKLQLLCFVGFCLVASALSASVEQRANTCGQGPGQDGAYCSSSKCPATHSSTNDCGLLSGKNCCVPKPSTPAPPTTQSLGDYATECGVSKYSNAGVLAGSDRIVGGSQAFEHEFPWIVSMTYFGDHFCGGSLIADRFVLTAAHCLPASMPTSAMKIVTGQHTQSSNSGKEDTFKIKKANVHKDYNSRTMKNDIAIVELEKAVPFDENVHAVCPDYDAFNVETTYVGDTSIVSGWGTLSSGGDLADELLKVGVPIITNSKCASQNSPNKIYKEQVCAGTDVGGVDSCQGDSGGPLIIKVDKASNGKPHNFDFFKQIGIVSWGIGCAAAKKPGVYTRVASYQSWIENIVNA